MEHSKMIYGVDSEKGYRPHPIPPRETSRRQVRNGSWNAARFPADPSADVFAEVDVAEASSGYAIGSAACDCEALASDRDLDEMRSLFSKMRQIAREGSWYRLAREEVFYRQAKLLEHFSDDYPAQGEFSCYFPRYSQMDSVQLRTYFTWRANVRKGRIAETSVSYAFLYIYELLNNIGVKDPQEGLDRLIEFWCEFRSFDPLIDRYVLPWLKDYHVFYPVEGSFRAFAADNLLQEHYPTVFCYGSGKDDSFGLFSKVSSYRIEASIFYTEQTAPIIEGCFYFVLTCLREAFEKRKKRFEDEVFFATRRRSKWAPFAKALFYPSFEQDDRLVVISDRESYQCKNRVWTGKPVLPSNHGSQLVGYIMKEIESFLRVEKKFERKLNVNISSFKTLDQGTFSELGISLPETIKGACAEYLKRSMRRTVTVDPGSLDQIRQDAYVTQEKLLAPEREGLAAAGLAANHTAASRLHDEASPRPAATAPTNQAQGCESHMPEHPLCPDASVLDDPWSSFRLALDSEEAEALALILEGGDIGRFAQQHGSMLEVFIDRINEKAMDCTGDVVIEVDESISVLEEYRPDLMKAVNG